MKKIIQYDQSLADLVDAGFTQRQIGEMLGVRQQAVTRMCRVGRDVYCKIIDGKWHYCEVKPYKRDPESRINRNKKGSE